MKTVILILILTVVIIGITWKFVHDAETEIFRRDFKVWLRWNLYVLGTAFICFVGYSFYFGTPTCLKTLDTQILQNKVDDLAQGMSEMEDFKTIASMKLERKK